MTDETDHLQHKHFITCFVIRRQADQKVKCARVLGVLARDSLDRGYQARYCKMRRFKMESLKGKIKAKPRVSWMNTGLPNRGESLCQLRRPS